MFTKALFSDTKTILAILGKSNLFKDAYLAGGTAAALQLGHRLSFDLDFFTSKEFNALNVIGGLQRIADFNLEETTEGTILGRIKDVRFSLFLYKYKLLFPLKNFLDISILDLGDIAAMKIAAISDRGTKRDFIDLYFICKTKISLGKVLKFYDKKYGKLASNLIHIKKSLVYFEDAEDQEMPKMLKPCKWEEVKGFFERKVEKIATKIL
jgi:predicted nucleotidyltransferase component of viral defense system